MQHAKSISIKEGSQKMRLENDLKPHNKDTYKKMQEILKTNNKTCIIQPTGSGKSYLILRLIEDYAMHNRDIIVIEPQKYIFEQLQKKMKKYGLPSNNVKFITYSALGKLDNEKIQEYDSPKLVLVDEMHRAGAPIWGSGLQKMFDVFPNDCKYIGFSATPIRFLDGKRNMAEELFNNCIANELGLADAILRRILPLPRYIAGLYTYENEVNAITRKIQSSHNADEEKEKLLEEVAVMKRNLDKSKGVSSIFKKYINQDKGKYIAFCRNINHLKQMKSCLEEWFSEAGISVNFYEVHCKNPEKDNQFSAFMADDKLAVCLSVAMLSEGIHGIDGVILLRDTTSPNLYYQQIGRVFAVDMDTVPIIFDLVANCESIMDCNLKNDLLSAIDKRDRDKDNEDACVNDGQDDEKVDDSNDCNAKKITKDDIESFFVFDQVIDAVNAFKQIEDKLINNNWSKNDEELIRQHYSTMGTKIKSMLSIERSNMAIKKKAHQLGLTFVDNWTKEDEDLMRKHYPSMGVKVKSMLSVEKSDRAIHMKAISMRLVYIKKNWCKEDKKFIKENYGKLSVKKIAKRLGKSENSVYLMASRLKLKFDNMYRNWNDEETKIFKQYYPTEGKKVADRLPYKTERQCLDKARILKLKFIDNKTSKYRYVSWSKRSKKWRVAFLVNGKTKHFGLFKDEDEAGRVALEKAKEFGKAV